MLDSHNILKNSEPIFLFFTPYSFFITFGIAVGLMHYYYDTKKRSIDRNGAVAIVFSGLLFGFIGAKIPLLFEGHDLRTILYGKSILGGILGGMFGVIGVKKTLKINMKLGNIIAPSLALGMAIGRIGCFLHGCCYGVVSTWGYDFGDGQQRLPTQLFEVGFHMVAFLVLCVCKDKVKTEGILFKLYVMIYFIFRFFMEFIRENPAIWQGLSVYQIICMVGFLYMAIMIVRGVKHERR